MLKHFLSLVLLVAATTIQAQVTANLSNHQPLNLKSYQVGNDSPALRFEDKRKLNSEQFSFFQIQVGLVHDMHKLSSYVKNNLDADRWEAPGYQTPYTGIAHFGFSFGQQNSNRIRGFELSRTAMEVLVDGISLESSEGLSRDELDAQRHKVVVDLMAFQLFRLGSGEKFLVYAGPDVGLGYARDEIDFGIYFSFPSYQRSIRLGIGARVQLQFQLTDNWYFQLSPRLTLLDFMQSDIGIDNPLLLYKHQRVSRSFVVEALRGEFYLPIGIGYRW